MENQIINERINEYSPGIKMLLTMKSEIDNTNNNDNINNNANNYDECSDDYLGIDELTDAEYKKNLREIDDLLLNIIRTKQKLKLGKVKSKIKTHKDLLNFMKIRDLDNNLIEIEENNNNSLDKLKINPNSKINNDYKLIRKKLLKQQENNALKNVLLINKNSDSDKNNLNSIFDEIKNAELKCDNLLADIDECLKLGEDLDKIIDEKYKII